jgi:hypothetical protein
MGEDHPAEKKVVVSFSPSATPLKLTPVQRSKLIKVAGTRYNPSTDTIKMSCESFETPAQNKRYLGDLVEIMLKEAKDASDTFEDVPFDFRHHTPKKNYKFPINWIVTPERKAEMLSARAAASLPAPSPSETDAEAVAIPVEVNVVDGLLHTRDGPTQRAREARIKNLIVTEDRDYHDVRTRKERRALLVARAKERAESERKLGLVDERARRKSKRPSVVLLPNERVMVEEGLVGRKFE